MTATWRAGWRAAAARLRPLSARLRLGLYRRRRRRLRAGRRGESGRSGEDRRRLHRRRLQFRRRPHRRHRRAEPGAARGFRRAARRVRRRRFNAEARRPARGHSRRRLQGDPGPRLSQLSPRPFRPRRRRQRMERGMAVHRRRQRRRGVARHDAGLRDALLCRRASAASSSRTSFWSARQASTPMATAPRDLFVAKG